MFGLVAQSVKLCFPDVNASAALKPYAFIVYHTLLITFALWSLSGHLALGFNGLSHSFGTFNGTATGMSLYTASLDYTTNALAYFTDPNRFGTTPALPTQPKCDRQHQFYPFFPMMALPTTYAGLDFDQDVAQCEAPPVCQVCSASSAPLCCVLIFSCDRYLRHPQSISHPLLLSI